MGMDDERGPPFLDKETRDRLMALATRTEERQKYLEELGKTPGFRNHPLSDGRESTKRHRGVPTGEEGKEGKEAEEEGVGIVAKGLGDLQIEGTPPNVTFSQGSPVTLGGHRDTGGFSREEGPPCMPPFKFGP
jgi:hypothetical protein